MAVDNREVLNLLAGLTSDSEPERVSACGTITDWISLFTPFQVRLLAMALSTAAVAESTPNCREEELHALAELSDTGFFTSECFEVLRDIDRDALGVSEREYLDALWEIDTY